MGKKKRGTQLRVSRFFFADVYITILQMSICRLLFLRPNEPV